MGAVIELIGVGRASTRVAVTGIDGQFFFRDVLSGTYRLHATASFLKPISTRAVRVSSGVEAVINLTLANIYDAGTWLPVERRGSDAAEDDWMWTMRSAASRPVLRVVGDGSRPGREEVSSRGSVPLSVGTLSQAGGFGGVRMSQEVVTGYSSADGTHRIATAVQYGDRAGAEGDGPVRLMAANTRQSAPWSRMSTIVGYEADPQIRSTSDGRGHRFLIVGSSQTLRLGDTVELQAGGLLAADGMRLGRLSGRPFGRVRVRLAKDWSVGYALATDRSLQQASDTEGTGRAGGQDLSNVMHGVGRLEHGHHGVVQVDYKGRSRRVSLGYYRDGLAETPVVGRGDLSVVETWMRERKVAPEAWIDGANGSFRVEGPGYRAQGCELAVWQALTPDEWVEVSLRSGAALTAFGQRGTPGLQASHGVAAEAAMHSRIRRSGTDLSVSYAWQPERFVTPVDPFQTVGSSGYLATSLRQVLPRRIAPRGAVVTLSGTNLLRQGMRAVKGSNQDVVALAQELPTLSAGIGFSF